MSNYDVKQLGQTILNVDAKGQSVFTIPVGVLISTDFDIGNSWKLSPLLDLGVRYAFGDLYSESTASYIDISPVDLSVQAYNKFTFNALIGLEFSKGYNTRTGISYEIEVSHDITAHNARLYFRYDF